MNLENREYREKLSIVLITKNSQKYLKEVLKSASFADEIVLVDSGSDDDTVKIAKEAGAKVFEQEWLGFGKQKQKAVDLASNDLVFVLDSDEVITDELKNEIMEILKRSGDSKNRTYRAYEVPRLNYFFGKPIKTCGLYPDATIRFFDRKFGRFSQDNVHEKVLLDSNLVEIGRLKNHFLHYAYESVEEFIAKQNRYSSLNAKPNRLKALINPIWTFKKLYFLKFGFLDGWRGFVISALYSQYTFWKYIK